MILEMPTSVATIGIAPHRRSPGCTIAVVFFAIVWVFVARDVALAFRWTAETSSFIETVTCGTTTARITTTGRFSNNGEAFTSDDAPLEIFVDGRVVYRHRGEYGNAGLADEVGCTAGAHAHAEVTIAFRQSRSTALRWRDGHYVETRATTYAEYRGSHRRTVAVVRGAVRAYVTDVGSGLLPGAYHMYMAGSPKRQPRDPATDVFSATLVRDGITYHVRPPDPGVRIENVRLVPTGARHEPTLVVYVYSGGMHCCWYTTAYRYEPNERRYATYTYVSTVAGTLTPGETEDGSTIFPVQLDEIGASFQGEAGRPQSPLAILELTAGGFRDTSRAHPDLLHRDARAAYGIFSMLPRFDDDRPPQIARYLADLCRVGDCVWAHRTAARRVDRKSLLKIDRVLQMGCVPYGTPVASGSFLADMRIPEVAKLCR